MANNEQRMQTFVLTFDGSQGLTGIKTLTKALYDVQGAEDALNASLSDGVSVTMKNIKSKEDEARQARLILDQYARTEKQVQQLTAQYQLQAQTVGKDRDEIERLNAVARLGANATQAQKDQVLASVAAFQQARAAAEETGGSLRNFRGVMQNVGWQVQDTAVQLQMGTSAFIVLSQQGSQLASAFGHGGAVVGAFIAVAGVVAMQLWPSLKNAGTAAEQVDKVFQSVNKTMKDGANDADIYTESFVKLYNANKSLGLLQLRLELSKLDSASTIASEGISKSIGKIGDDVLSVPVVPMDGFTQVNSGVLQITGTMGNSAPVLDGYTKSLLDLKNVSADINKNGFNDQNLKAYESALLSVSKTGDIANKDLQAFLQTNNEILVSQISITNKKKELQKALSELGVSDKPLLTPQQKQDTKDTLREFDSLSNALIKKTETTQEEYLRQKTIIDKASKAEGSDPEKIKTAYAALEAWKTSELKKESDKRSKASTTAWNKEDAEFQSLAKSLVKQTNTTQEEYDRRKAIIDAHVKAVGSTDTQAAQAYIDLEVWKTSELEKELKTREAVLKQLQDAQDTQFGKTNPVGQENDLFKENQAKLQQLWLDNQLSQQTNHDQKLIDEEMRINALMEREAKRHTDKLDKIALSQKEAELRTYGEFTSSLGNVFSQLQQAAQDGSKEAQMLFYVNRAIALANTIINTEAAAMAAANAKPIFGIAAASMIRGMGYASAGIIAGTTFAGAYDAGGYIPSGSSGIVSEYADELVNGTLVQGPAHVTSSAKTAQKMGTTLNVQVANQIDGATYDVQQIDEETVKIIARRELSKNIDKSVASVMSNPNSRTRKATSSSYSLKRKF